MFIFSGRYIIYKKPWYNITGVILIKDEGEVRVNGPELRADDNIISKFSANLVQSAIIFCTSRK